MLKHGAALSCCERHLAWLDMALDVKKSVCLRFGPRYDAECGPLVTISRQRLAWVESCRYLGVYLCAARNGKCLFDEAKKAYYRSFNAVFGKIGRHASEEVTLKLKLIQTKCLPVILYGLDACPVNAADKHSLNLLVTRSLMKLFQTGSIVVIEERRRVFNVKQLSELVLQRVSCQNTARV